MEHHGDVADPSASSPEGVVLLHGLLRSEIPMRKLANALERAGYRVTNVDYDSRCADIETQAGNVIPTALAHPQLEGCRRVHFVTHSLGGILLRCYTRDRAIPNLGRVVMLGPPNQGSEVVDHLRRFRWFNQMHGPAGAQLGTGPDSIPSQLGPVPFELGVIAGDRSINWINSLMVPGPDDGKVSVERTKVEGMRDHRVVHATHTFMMRNREVIALTLRFLETGSFSAR